VSSGLKRILPLRHHRGLALGLAALAGTAACGRGRDAETARQAATLAEALRPAYFSEAMRRVGGAHYHGTARFAAGLGAADDAVTTTTDVWVDRSRNFKLAETNDRDGGREVVLTGRELFVALRYGKMIRRVAEEPEPTRLLEEGLGGPWAAWEIVQPYARIERAGAQSFGGARATEYRLSRAGARVDDPSAQPPATGLRAWRATAVVSDLQGSALVDDASGALLKLDLTAKFTAKREGRALEGAVEVHGALSEVASTPAIQRPAFEDMALRQRLVPEQRELLAGLPSTRGLPAQAPKAAPRPAAPRTAAPAPSAAPPAPAPAPPKAPQPPRKGWSQ
jgi:hypothetical protein